MAAAVAAIFFYFKLVRGTPLVFGRGVVFAFASLANQLNNISCHIFPSNNYGGAPYSRLFIQ
jgi:hypothetical protein